MDGQAPENLEPRKVARRTLLLGGVAAVAGAALTRTRDAAAAVINFALGQSNASSAQTTLQMGGAPPQIPALRVDNQSSTGSGIGLMGTIQAPPLSVTMSAGVFGLAGVTGGGVLGIAGGLSGAPGVSNANTGVTGIAPGGTAVQGISDTGTGVVGGGRSGVVGKVSTSGPGNNGLSAGAGVVGFGPPGAGAAVVGVGGGFTSPVGITVTADAGVVGISPRAGVTGLIPSAGTGPRIAVHGGFLDSQGAFIDPSTSAVVAGVVGTSPPGSGFGVIGAGGGFRGAPAAVMMTAETGILGIGPTTGIVGAAVDSSQGLGIVVGVPPSARVGILGLGGQLGDGGGLTVTADLQSGIVGISPGAAIVGASRTSTQTGPVGLGGLLGAGLVGIRGDTRSVRLTAESGIVGISPGSGVIGLGGFGSSYTGGVNVTGSSGLLGVSPGAGVVGVLHTGSGPIGGGETTIVHPIGAGVIGMTGEPRAVTVTALNVVETGVLGMGNLAGIIGIAGEGSATPDGGAVGFAVAPGAAVGMAGLSRGIGSVTITASVGVVGGSPRVGLLGFSGKFDSAALTPTLTAGVFGIAGFPDGAGVVARHPSGGLALDVSGRARFSTSGTGTIPVAVDTLFVADSSVSTTSHVLVTLTGDPGKLCSLQWVEPAPGFGFTIHLQGRTRRSTSFVYLVLDR